MDLNNQLDNEMRSLDFNKKAKSYLMETTKWATFLSVVGFCGLVLSLLFLGYTCWTMPSLPVDFRGQFYVIIGIYIFILCLHLIPIQSLYKFSRLTRKGLKDKDSESLTLGMENLKATYKFFGVFTIVLLVLYTIFLLCIWLLY